MSTEKNNSSRSSHVENAQLGSHAGPMPTVQPAVTLTQEQYERLFFQPASGQPAKSREFARRFGNPTPAGLLVFLLVLTPASWILMQVNKTTPTSLAALVGPFFFLGGVGNFIACFFEWFAGNTFPFVVFITFGGFWSSMGILFNPAIDIPSAFSGGSSAPEYNTGLEFFFIFYGVLCVVFTLAALRTNIGLVILFFLLVLTFAFLAAAYDRIGHGNVPLGLTYFKVSGAFAFVACIAGWYLAIALIFLAVDMPFTLPVGDLSTRILVRRRY